MWQSSPHLYPYAYSNNNHVLKIDSDGRIESLIKTEVKEITKFIKSNSGKSEAFQNNGIGYSNYIAIESFADNRQAMVNEVSRDNGKGGIADANNREYGDSIQNGRVVIVPAGAVSNPATQANASIELPVGGTTFHSHPSGIRSEAVEGGTRYTWFSPPLSYRCKWFKYRDGICVWCGNGEVYIYNSNGVQAVCYY